MKRLLFIINFCTFNRTVDRWWGCRVYYCVLYLASSILHISMIYLILIVCCMCCSPYWCSLYGTHSDNRHSGFLHDHLELLYHRQNRDSLSWHVGLLLGGNRQYSLYNKCTQIYQIVFFLVFINMLEWRSFIFVDAERLRALTCSMLIDLSIICW
jgi:hypothetical protein